MASSPQPPRRSSGRSQTRTTSEGKVLALDEPLDKGYLCAHACQCNKGTTLRNKLGHELKQRCTTKIVWGEEEVNQLVWRYKAEVGYSMKANPPAPIMSRDQPNRPSRFPLGAALGQGILKRDFEGRLQKGLLRIPDCIVLKVTTPELIAMRAGQQIDWPRLIPVQRNIETVVEIKFAGDELGREQKDAYERIAGSSSKFRLLEVKDCECGDDEGKRRRQSETETSPERSPVITPILPPLGGGRKPPFGPGAAPIPAPQPVRPQYGPVAQPGQGTPLSEHLKNAAIVGGCIVLGILAVEFVPIGLVGAALVRLVVLGAGAAAAVTVPATAATTQSPKKP